jgi:hypothetical protein
VLSLGYQLNMQDILHVIDAAKVRLICQFVFLNLGRVL